MSDVRWTAKAPALIAAAVLAIAGLVATSKRAFVVSIVLFGLAFAFLAYSLTIKEWCELHGTTLGGTAWGQGGFGGSFGDCVREKGWASF